MSGAAKRTSVVIHGRASSYTQRGCRCDACKAAHRDELREYRAKHPDGRAKDKARRALYSKAHYILRDRHRAEFDAILAALTESADHARETDHNGAGIDGAGEPAG